MKLSKKVKGRDQDKYCMPDGINSKVEHEKYLKVIGMQTKEQKLANKIVNMLNGEYALNLKTVDSSHISESIVKIFEQDLKGGGSDE